MQPSLGGIFIPAKFQQIPVFHPATCPDFPLSTFAKSEKSQFRAAALSARGQPHQKEVQTVPIRYL